MSRLSPAAVARVAGLSLAALAVALPSSASMPAAFIPSVAAATTAEPSGQDGRPALIAPPRGLTARSAAAADALPGVAASLTAAQEAQLADLAKMIDSRVLEGFRGREALKARMEADLRDLAKISDRTARARAIGVFQTRYAEDYRKVLAAGGVDLQQVAERLRVIFPGTVFVVEDGTHVVTADPQPAPAPEPAPIPETKTQRLTGAQMTQDPRSDGCGGGGSGRIDTSRPSGQTNSGRVSNIGRCSGVGFMNFRYDVPQGMKSLVSGRVNLNAEASVVAVTGAAYASANVRVMHTDGSESSRGFGLFPSAGATVWVAVAWAASKSDPRPRQPIEETDFRGQAGPVGVNHFRARTFTSAWSASFHGDADAWASVQEIDALITIRPFSVTESR